MVTVGGQQICDVLLLADGHYPITLGGAAAGRPAVARVRVWDDGP